MIGALLSLVGVGWFMGWMMQPKHKSSPHYDYMELSARVRRIAKTQKQIDTLEEMIMDIETCEPGEMHRNFSCVWQAGDNNKTYDFWTDGANGTSEDMLFLAQRERQRLRASLVKQIDELETQRRYGNITETIDISAGEGSAWTE